MITRLFLWLFWPCRHRWKRIQETGVYETPDANRPYKTLYTLQCEKCGNITSKEIS